MQPLFKAPDGDPLNRPAFALRVLGPFELVAESTGDPIPVPTAKMRALLAYLAASPHASESRRRLAGLLWADRSEERARQSMRQMLSNFRRGGGGEFLLAPDEEDVGLDQSLVAIDRGALMAGSTETDVAALSAAADLYRGDFAAGLEVGEPEFDAWLQAERTRCREAAIALFDRLVRALADLGRHEEALRRAIRLAEIDPLREETLRLVMAEEAIVSGRASAMRRYEAFRVLLKDELGIRPEAATLRLLDDLRRQEAAEPGPPAIAIATGQGRSESARTMPVPRPRRTWWRPSAIAASLAVLLLLAGAAAMALWRPAEAPTAFIDDDTGRASVVLLPFEAAAGDNGLIARSRAFEVEARLAFARHMRLTLVEAPGSGIVRDAAAAGRALRARYVVRTLLTATDGGTEADISLLDSATGAIVATTPLALTGPPVAFAGAMRRYVATEIVLHRARTLSAASPDSIPALLWRAAAAQSRTGVGSTDPDAFALYDEVLVRDRKQLIALLALAGRLTLRVARQQSGDRAARAADIDRAASLLQQARRLAPNSAEVAFLEGMVAKERHLYEQALRDFETAFRRDPNHSHAAVQVAHVKLFLGRFEEAYDEMEVAAPKSLPEGDAAEIAFLAGETALVTSHVERAVAYLDMAVADNATVARIHALRASALWMHGRAAEAHAAAAQALKIDPPFPPERAARRGGADTSPRYQAARDRYVAAFRSALAWSATP